MKKRILAIILSVCMLIGAVPSIVLAAVESGIPRYIDPDTSGDTILSLIEEQTPAVPDGVVTPFGKTGSKTIVERSEFFYHNAFNSSFVHTADESSETKYNIFRALQHLSYPRAVAFDPIGSGKRDHLAVLGLRYNADQTNGTSYLYIFNLENDTLVKTYEFDANWFGWAKDLDITESNNYFAITAGDYDNDGRDSLIIYNSAMRGPNQERALKEIKYNGTSWTDPNKEYIYISVDKLFNTDYMRGNVSGTFIRESNAIRDKLCVSLETGDVDGDGIDDLIVLSSAARISSKFESLHRASIPMLAIARGKEGASSINSLAVSSTRFSTESNGDTYTMAASSVSVGDINLDGKDEIIVAGFNVINGFNNSVLFVEEKNGYQTYSSIRYYVCDFDGKNINNCGGEALSSKDKKASTINSPLNKAQHNIWMQFSNEIVSFDDIDKTPSVFLNGLIYDISYDSDKGQYKLTPASGAPNFILDDPSVDSVGNFYNTSIKSTAVGLNWKAVSGRETLSFVVAHKINEKGNKYYYVNITYGKNKNGKWETIRTFNSNKLEYTRTSSGVFVADVDVGNDSVSVRYRTTLSAYTDPNVIAFLQAAPYYSDLGAGNSSTTYSYTESYTKSTSTGTQISAGLGIAASFETPALSTEIETSILESISTEFTESLTREFTTTFEANDKNQVVLRRTLVYLYCYDLLTGYDANGKPKYEECGLVLTVPQYPVLTSLSMEQYDAFAEAYNKKYGKSGAPLDIISKNNGALMKKYFLNNEGNPLAYAPELSSYKQGYKMTKDNTWMNLSHSGGTSQLGFSSSVGSEYTKTVSDGISVNVALTVGSSFAGFGASVGVTSSLESLKSNGVTSSQVTTTATGGAVQNLSDEEYAYSFDWTLIGWKTEPADRLFAGVPFIGYAVRSASAPPPCINDLTYTLSETPGVAYLKWTAPKSDEGRLIYTGFAVYRIDNGKRIPLGSTTTSGYAVSIDETASPDTSAVYVVVTVNSTTNQTSIDSNEVLVVFSPSKSQVDKMIEDACKDLETAIADLKTAFDGGQTDAIQKAVEDLTKAYKEADELIKSDITEKTAALETLMEEAKKDLGKAIDAVQNNLNKAIADLTKLINEGDETNSDALSKAVASLTDAYKAADALLKNELAESLAEKTSALEEKLADLEKKMNDADAALKIAIDAVQKNLDDAVTNLNKLIKDGDTANAEALQKAIADLTAAYQTADNLLKADITALEEKLAALEKKMKAADAALQSAIDRVQKNLDLAIAELSKAAAEGDAATVEKLNAAIEALTKAYKAADEVLNGSVKELESADKALQESQKAMQQEIDLLKSELQTLKDQLVAQKLEYSEKLQSVSTVAGEQETQIGSLKTLATVGACISVVSLLGNIALLAAFLVEKKKHFTSVN